MGSYTQKIIKNAFSQIIKCGWTMKENEKIKVLEDKQIRKEWNEQE